ncbi:hypothetical protein ACQ4PT_008744 [Festuca glaucescens]
MEAPARCAEDRPALVRVAALRSAAIAEEERRLTRLGVVAVIVGWCPDMELPDVARAFARHFRLLEDVVQVTLLALGEFLIVFSTVAARNATVQWQGAVPFDRVLFMVSPWSRFRKATAGRLSYKVRVYSEGIPPSAHNWEVVKGLFDSSVIFDSIDNSLNSKEDSACFKVWVWMANVGSLARRGMLDLEEPLEVDSPLLHFPELGILADRPVRSGPVKTLSYNIILHLDRVLDYSGSPSSSPESHASFHINVSGLPSETSSTPEYPITWGYRWYLGYEAVTFPPSRASAHSRLSFPDGRGRRSQRSWRCCWRGSAWRRRGPARKELTLGPASQPGKVRIADGWPRVLRCKPPPVDGCCLRDRRCRGA